VTARVIDIGGIVDHDFLFIVVVCSGVSGYTRVLGFARKPRKKLKN
jgi:hypothetical protein